MREIEYKFALPDSDESHNGFVDCVARDLGYEIGDVVNCQRLITYYDTDKLDLLRMGNTLRKVDGFEDGSYRFDLKQGSLEERTEDSIKSTNPLIEFFLSTLTYAPVLQNVEMGYEKRNLRRGETVIEASVDTTPFYREIEFELHAGNEKDLDEFAHYFSNKHPNSVYVQKYLKTFAASQPQLRGLMDVKQNNIWHQDNVFDHSVSTVNELSNVIEEFGFGGDRYLLWIAGLYHDVGKAITKVGPKFPGHEMQGARDADLSFYSLNRNEDEHVRKIIAEHGVADQIIGMRGYHAILERENCEELLLLSLADLRVSDLDKNCPDEYVDRKTKIEELMAELRK